MVDGGICTEFIIPNDSPKVSVHGLMDTDGLLSLDEGRNKLPLKINNGVNQQPKAAELYLGLVAT